MADHLLAGQVAPDPHRTASMGPGGISVGPVEEIVGDRDLGIQDPLMEPRLGDHDHTWVAGLSSVSQVTYFGSVRK